MPWIRAADFGSAVLLVDCRDGGVRVLTGRAARWWSAAAGAEDSSSSLELPKELGSLVSHLRKAGVLHEPRQLHRWPAPMKGPEWEPVWGQEDLPFGFSPFPGGRVRRATLAAVVLLQVLAARRGRSPMLNLMRMVERAAQGGRRAATEGEISAAVNAVRRAGLWLPMRIACLENSVAAVVILGQAGLIARWCHGASADPLRVHAWVETCSGVPVAEPPSTRRCVALMKIPSSEVEV